MTVPYGTFDVMVLREVCYGAGNHSGTYYLDAAVGPVILPGGYQLVSVDGSISTVGSTWSGVKTLFR